MSLVNEALDYLRQNFSIIPIGSDKRPLIKWTEYQTRRATEEEVRGWFTKWPDANIGLVTGKISDTVVVDIDDIEIGFKNLAEYIPSGIKTPTAQTPADGYHLFFKCPAVEVRNNAKVIPGCDFRGEGGYVVVAPSFCKYEKGKKQIEGFYRWSENCSIKDLALESLPDAYISFINSFSLYKGSLTCLGDKSVEISTSQYESVTLFNEGERGEGIFHVANSLVKGLCNPRITRYVLELVARNCNPPFPEKEIEARIRSAMDRVARKEKNLAADFREWIKSAPGQFKVSEYHHESAVVSKEDKHAIIVEAKKLCDQGILQRIGVRRGEYRIVDTEMEFMDFVNVKQEGLLDIELPLEIHKKTTIFPKAVIILAGVTGFGKTTWLLNIIRDNMHKYKFYYFNAEMSPLALNTKLGYFTTRPEDWNMKVIPDHIWDYSNIADKIFPDDINVIDYLEPEGEKAYNIHGVVTAIIKRLDKGIAIIATQKRPDVDLSAGGVYSAKAASLYLSLDWGRIKIFKNRYREADKNPSLNMRDFEITSNTQAIKKRGGWYSEQIKKRENMTRQYEDQTGAIDDRQPGEDDEGGHIK